LDRDCPGNAELSWQTTGPERPEALALDRGTTFAIPPKRNDRLHQAQARNLIRLVASQKRLSSDYRATPSNPKP